MVLLAVMDNPDATVCPATPAGQVLMVNLECKGNREHPVLLVKTVDLDATDQKVQMAPKGILEDGELVVNKAETVKREEADHLVLVDSLDHQEHLDQMFESISILLKTWFTSFVTNYYKLYKFGAREQNQL